MSVNCWQNKNSHY